MLTVDVSASDGDDADRGFLVEWSDDGSTWIPLATVRQAAPVDAAFGIGAPTGTVWVCVVDTDRSRGPLRLCRDAVGDRSDYTPGNEGC